MDELISSVIFTLSGQSQGETTPEAALHEAFWEILKSLLGTLQQAGEGNALSSGAADEEPDGSEGVSADTEPADNDLEYTLDSTILTGLVEKGMLLLPEGMSLKGQRLTGQQHSIDGSVLPIRVLKEIIFLPDRDDMVETDRAQAAEGDDTNIKDVVTDLREEDALNRDIPEASSEYSEEGSTIIEEDTGVHREDGTVSVSPPDTEVTEHIQDSMQQEEAESNDRESSEMFFKVKDDPERTFSDLAAEVQTEAGTSERPSTSTNLSLDKADTEISMPGEVDPVFERVQSDSSSVEVSVNHEELGRLDIKLRHYNGTVQGQINIYEPVAREFLQRNLNHILGLLSQEGINVGDFSLVYKDRDNRDYSEEQLAQRRRWEKASDGLSDHTGILSTGTISIIV